MSFTKRIVMTALVALFVAGTAFGSGKQPTLTIYVVRHGQTVFNLMDRVQGISDAVLTQKGIDGAVNMGKGLRDVKFGAVYSSDLGRARETARLAMEQNQATKKWNVVEMPELREVSFGIFEGEPNADMYIAFAKDLGIDVPAGGNVGAVFGALAQRFPRNKGFLEALSDFNKKIDTKYQVAESAAEVNARLQKGLDAILAANPKGGNVMLVAHGQSIGFLFNQLGIPMPPSGQLENSSVTKIVYDYESKTFSYDVVGDMSYAERGAQL